MSKNATLAQGIEILQMIQSGKLDRDMAQALIEGRVDIRMESYRILCRYGIPPYEVLQKRFKEVDPEYEEARFKPIDELKHLKLDTAKIGLELVRLGKHAQTREVLDALRERGFRPAPYEELLEFALEVPVQKLNRPDRYRPPVVALGSVQEKREYSPVLHCLIDGYGLDLQGHNLAWNPSHCFLAVPLA